MKLKPGVPFEPQKFRKEIRKAGYETRGFELALRAWVERRGKAYELRPAGVAQAYAVLSGPAASGLADLVGKVVRAQARVVSEGPTMELELLDVKPAGG